MLGAADIVDGGDVGMIEVGDGAGFGQVGFGEPRVACLERFGDVPWLGEELVVVEGSVQRAGDRVVIPSTIACGSCSYCRAGYQAQCDNGVTSRNTRLKSTSLGPPITSKNPKKR